MLDRVTLELCVVPDVEELRAELHGISTNLGASSFGAVTSAYDPRIIQLALKLNL